MLSPSTTPALDEEMGENLDQIGPPEGPEVRFRSLVQFLVAKISCASDVGGSTSERGHSARVRGLGEGRAKVEGAH